MRIAIVVLPHRKLFRCMVDHQSKLHRFSPLAQLSLALPAPIRYDGREAVHSTALTKSAADFIWSRRPSPFLVDDGLCGSYSSEPDSNITSGLPPNHPRCWAGPNYGHPIGNQMADAERDRTRRKN